jgi:hypothetical protein
MPDTKISPGSLPICLAISGKWLALINIAMPIARRGAHQTGNRFRGCHSHPVKHRIFPYGMSNTQAR